MKKSLIVLTFFLGFFIGMASKELVLPVFNHTDTPYYHGTRGSNQVALTFNVDWGSEYIPAILQTLKNSDVKVTFFVTGTWASANRDLLNTMAEAGHEIGNHGYDHSHPAQLNRESLTQLILKNEKLIKEITGLKTVLFAPPYGEVNSRITVIASSLGYKTIMWSADTIDWQRPAPEIIVQRAVNKIDDGGIILMHPTSPSVTALPEIIAKIKKRNFSFVTVSKLINH